jgi:hypothetical protein
MRGRTGALLTVVAGMGALALAASAQQQRSLSAVIAPPSPAQSRPVAIDWAAAQKQAQSGVTERGRALNAKFIAANRAEIAKIAIPVLLPGDPDLAQGLRIFGNGAYYTASSSSNGMSFVLTGSGRAFPLSPRTVRALPGAGLAGRIPADGISVEGTEAGLDASFGRFGASYSISLECRTPTDPRCNDQGYVRGVIARLTVIIPGSGP